MTFYFYLYLFRTTGRRPFTKIHITRIHAINHIATPYYNNNNMPHSEQHNALDNAHNTIWGKYSKICVRFLQASSSTIFSTPLHRSSLYLNPRNDTFIRPLKTNHPAKHSVTMTTHTHATAQASQTLLNTPTPCTLLLPLVIPQKHNTPRQCFNFPSHVFYHVHRAGDSRGALYDTMRLHSFIR